MQYVIIDFFGTEPYIVCDIKRNTTYFETNEEAEKYAKENLQMNYKIVEI